MWLTEPQGVGGSLAGAALVAFLIDGCHDDPVGRDADDEERVVAGAAAVEIDAAMPRGDESFGGTGAHRGSVAAVEPDHVAGGGVVGPVAVLVHLEPVHPRIPLGDDQHPVILYPAAVEVVAAAIHHDRGGGA